MRYLQENLRSFANLSHSGDMSEQKYVPKTDRRDSIREIRGLQHRFSEWGEPPSRKLFLLHGWGDTGASFQFVVDQLSKDWHVIAPDFRGFGDSEHPDTGYWFPDYLADLDAMLAHFSPDEPAAILGHSMGGNIAGLYAGVFPDRVSHFINVDAFGLANRDPNDAPANYRRWISQVQSTQSYSDFDSFEDLAAVIRKRSPRMDESHALYVAKLWGRMDGGRVKIKADPLHKMTNPVLYRRAEAEACWQAVTAEVLIVIGGESVFRHGDSNWFGDDRMDWHYPKLETAVIEDAGHMIHFEQPAALARRIEDFL